MEEMTLHKPKVRELVKEQHKTQEEMADILEMRQANISKVEKRDDMLVSTLRAYRGYGGYAGAGGSIAWVHTG